MKKDIRHSTATCYRRARLRCCDREDFAYWRGKDFVREAVFCADAERDWCLGKVAQGLCIHPELPLNQPEDAGK